MKCIVFAAALFGLLIRPAFPQIGLPWPGPGSISSTPPVIAAPITLGTNITTAAIRSSVALTTSAAIPAGALAIVGVFVPFGGANSVSGVSDGTNTYTLAVTDVWDAATSTDIEIWYKENASAVSSSATITATFTGSTIAQPSTISAVYVTGTLSASSFDKANHGLTNNGTAYASGSTGALTISNEIGIGFVGEFNASVTLTDGAGFTNVNATAQGSGSFFNTKLSYKLVAATTALNYQPSTSAATFGKTLIATFKGH